MKGEKSSTPKSFAAKHSPEPTKLTHHGFLVSKETDVLRQWESETKIWFHQTS